MNSQSKSLLPLVEILISTAIFGLAVGLTLQLFMLAKFLGDKTSDMADAMSEAQFVAETIKSLKTEEAMKDFLNNEVETTDKNGFYTIYYSKEWQRIANENDAEFIAILYLDKFEYSSGNFYKYSVYLYRFTPYAYVDKKELAKDLKFKPQLATLSSGVFVAKEWLKFKHEHKDTLIVDENGEIIKPDESKESEENNEQIENENENVTNESESETEKEAAE